MSRGHLSYYIERKPSVGPSTVGESWPVLKATGSRKFLPHRAFSLIQLLGVLSLICLLTAFVAPQTMRMLGHKTTGATQSAWDALAHAVSADNASAPAAPGSPAAANERLVENARELVRQSGEVHRQISVETAMQGGGAATTAVQRATKIQATP